MVVWGWSNMLYESMLFLGGLVLFVAVVWRYWVSDFRWR